MRYFAVFWAKGEKDFFNFKALKPSLIILAIILKMIPMNSQIQISYNMFCSDLFFWDSQCGLILGALELSCPPILPLSMWWISNHSSAEKQTRVWYLQIKDQHRFASDFKNDEREAKSEQWHSCAAFPRLWISRCCSWSWRLHTPRGNGVVIDVSKILSFIFWYLYN